MPTDLMPRNRVRTAALVIILALCAACGTLDDSKALGKADSAFAQGHYHQAKTAYELYLQANPQGRLRWHAWKRILDIATDVEKNLDKSVQILEAMNLEFGEDQDKITELKIEQARILTTASHYDQALEAWQDLLAMGENALPLWKIHWNIGKIHQFKGNYAQARDSMIACLDSAATPADKAECSYQLALANSFLGNRDQATKVIERILAEPQTPREIKALSAYLLSDILETQGHKDKARELLLSIKDDYPNPAAIKARLKHLDKK